MLTATTFALITETDYYGPSTKHRLAAVLDTIDDARAAESEANSGLRELGHNVSGSREVAAEVIETINPTDWQSWPAAMFDAAVRLVEESGINPEDSQAIDAAERDWAADAAIAAGLILVVDDYGDCLLCRQVA